jgi:hypothetical protein
MNEIKVSINRNFKLLIITLLEHQSSPLVFSGVHVTQDLVLCVMFCCLLFVLFKTLQIFIHPALVFNTRHWVNITIYRTVYLHTDMCLQTLTHIQLKNQL